MERENHGFFTYLFMTIAGIAFIIIGIFPITFIPFGMVQDKYKDKNEISIKATIVSVNMTYNKSLDYYKKIYQIEYNVGDIIYSKTINGNIMDKHKEGDEVEVVYINNPQKADFPKRYNFKLDDIVIFGSTLPFLILGIVCIVKYNVFKYKKEIEVV